jgi:hypothetical protein
MFWFSSQQNAVVVDTGWAIRHRRVWSRDNALDLYSWGCWFESLPGCRISWLWFSWLSSVPPCKCWDSTSIRARLLPSKSFQLIIRLSFYRPTPYILDNEMAPLNTPRKKKKDHQMSQWGVYLCFNRYCSLDLCRKQIFIDRMLYVNEILI